MIWTEKIWSESWSRGNCSGFLDLSFLQKGGVKTLMELIESIGKGVIPNWHIDSVTGNQLYAKTVTTCHTNMMKYKKDTTYKLTSLVLRQNIYKTHGRSVTFYKIKKLLKFLTSRPFWKVNNNTECIIQKWVEFTCIFFLTNFF